MRSIIKISVVILVSILFYSCKKDEPSIPEITTRVASEISTTTAISGGDVTNEGGAPLTYKGVCWNTSPDPTLDQNKTIETSGSGSFASNISQLSPNTTYYVRAYAINIAGTGYGKSVSFKTLGDKPVPNAAPATNIQLNSATLNGTVNPNSLSTIVTFEYGTTVSYGSTITAAQSPITGNTTANVSADLTGLMPGSVYHFRIKAENSLGITYSSDLTLTTLGQAPTVTTQPATSLQLNSATINGTVNPNLLSTTASFEWGMTTDYGNTVSAIQNPVTGSSIVNINANLSGLAPGTTYHFRIKGENSVGITYSDDLTFTTLGQVPTATPQNATNLQTNSSTLNGIVNANYLSTTITFEWGTTTSYGSTATAAQSPITGSTALSVSADLSVLTPGTTYHFRIKAENLLGITYSADMTFTTLGQVPSVIMLPASNLQINTATLNATINANYLSSSVAFEWGTTTSYGSIMIPAQNPVTGNSSTNVSANLTGLTPGTTYHFRITAINELGTTYGSDLTFTTLGQVPTASPLDATNLQINCAKINGSVNANYLSTTASFEWGATTSYGSAVDALQNPVTGNIAINISADISGLTPGTTYHFRIKAINELGTVYSNDLTFTTLSPISDIDGNIYGIITIGTQVWMTENLKTIRYNNGDIIGTTTPALLDISGESNPKYQWPCGGEESNVSTYGRLYTWFTATDSRSICPTGWRIPTDNEWTTLTNYLINNGYGFGGSGNQIAKSMSSTSFWISDPTIGAPGNNQASNNSSGFNGVPGGVHSFFTGGSDFSSLGGSTAWWSSTELEPNVAWQRILVFNSGDLLRSYFGGKKTGIPVRCIKN